MNSFVPLCIRMVVLLSVALWASFAVAQVRPLKLTTVDHYVGPKGQTRMLGQSVCVAIFESQSTYYCITCSHCLTAADEAWIEGQPATVIATDVQSETALLSVRSATPLPIVPTRSQAPWARSGWLVSPPSKEWRAVQRGRIVGDVIDLEVIPGQSGSPIVSEDGVLIGLVHMSNGKFIPWQDFVVLLKKAGYLN